jgi:small redox-active disulfide protein 2
MHVTILGPGCRNCHRLETNTRQALERLGLDAVVETVTDPAAIAGYGVMTTPGLVVDERVVVVGRVPSTEEISALLQPVT